MSRRFRNYTNGAWAAVVLGALTLGGLSVWQSKPRLPPGVSADFYERAVAAYEREYHTRPDRASVLWIIAKAAASRGEIETALASVAEIPTDHPQYGARARFREAELALALHLADRAERNLREFLAHAGHSGHRERALQSAAQRMLATLLTLELRFDEEREVLRSLCETGQADVPTALRYCFMRSNRLNRWKVSNARAAFRKLWQRDSNDYFLNLAMGRYRTVERRFHEAQRLLEDCCRRRPGDLSAQAALLSCLFSQQQWEEIERIVAELPPHRPTEPFGLMLLRGRLHNHRHEHEAAVACFQAALKKFPASAECRLGLAEAYGGLGRHELRQAALRDVNVLARIQNRISWVRQSPHETKPLIEIIELCREIGLNQEASLLAAALKAERPEEPPIRQAVGQLRTEPPLRLKEK